MLQSNGIVWVEGPSDRVYINRWIKIFGEQDFVEGRDYLFLYYGGRLLAHYTAEEVKSNLINILLTNRNSAIVIDSDNRNEQSDINDTKKRIKTEFDNVKVLCWITKGKEIENYIPKEAIEKAYNKQLKLQCGQYELFEDYIQHIYSNFKGKKVPFANTICEYITDENSNDILDLKTQVMALCNAIKGWN